MKRALNDFFNAERPSLDVELSDFYFMNDLTLSGGIVHPIILTLGMPSVDSPNNPIINIVTPNG